jgi:hypothetical protein
VSAALEGFWCTAIIWQIKATVTDSNGRTASTSILFDSGSIGC